MFNGSLVAISTPMKKMVKLIMIAIADLLVFI